MLVGARLFQGVGGAMSSAVILGMIFLMFQEPAEQAKAIGVFGFVASSGGSLGLILGGVLTESINWHWIFFINIPIGIAVGVMAQKLLTKDQGIGLDKGMDAPGALLITAALMTGVYTIVSPAASYGWGATRTLEWAAASIALFAAFVWREATAKTPLIPLRVFRSRNLSGANTIQALLVAGMFGVFFLGALYMEQVLGYTPLQIGLAYLPMTLIMATISLKFSEPLIMRFGAKRLLPPSLSLIAIGLLWFARAPVDGNYLTDVLPTMIIMGFGIGPCFPALMTLAMSDSTAEDAGLASGLINTSAQIGGALGLAVLATMSATRTQHLLADGESQIEALVGGFRIAFLIGAGCLVAAVALALTVIKGVRAPAPHGAPAESQPATEGA
jgi:EmrB/QacA subfamily drug resistance transporter